VAAPADRAAIHHSGHMTPQLDHDGSPHVARIRLSGSTRWIPCPHCGEPIVLLDADDWPAPVDPPQTVGSGLAGAGPDGVGPGPVDPDGRLPPVAVPSIERDVDQIAPRVRAMVLADPDIIADLSGAALALDPRLADFIAARTTDGGDGGVHAWCQLLSDLADLLDLGRKNLRSFAGDIALTTARSLGPSEPLAVSFASLVSTVVGGALSPVHDAATALRLIGVGLCSVNGAVGDCTCLPGVVRTFAVEALVVDHATRGAVDAVGAHRMAAVAEEAVRRLVRRAVSVPTYEFMRALGQPSAARAAIPGNAAAGPWNATPLIATPPPVSSPPSSGVTPPPTAPPLPRRERRRPDDEPGRGT
jgi:hypothetical protein